LILSGARIILNQPRLIENPYWFGKATVTEVAPEQGLETERLRDKTFNL